ncbi:MAG: hypothetical protein F2808_03155 [Actinobacteria bacterium]|uniref:Unannotated protein n=1 Tax=freshwater metagenome TaxID=449393 RepID=A0A6J7FL81_9ZZZZ|nr:hypothetical protein [Actinomycetota bacterium]
MTDTMRSGARTVVVATIVAGGLAYLLTMLAAKFLGDDYSRFAIFWSTLYVFVGAIAGIQQEFARAVSRNSHESLASASRARVDVVAVGASVTAAVVAVLILLPLGGQLFGADSPVLIGQLILGVFFASLSLSITGVFYGLHSWWLIALIVVGDATFRFVGFLIADALGAGIVGFALVTVIPFLLTICISLLITRRRYPGNIVMEGTYVKVSTRVARTVVASVGGAILVNGMPVALGAVSYGAAPAALSAVFLVMTLTRAPLVVGSVSLQSYIVVAFRDSAGKIVRRVLAYLLGVLAIGIILSAIAYVIGPPIVEWIAGARFALSPLFFALVTVSSISTAWLVVTGAATLSQSRHTWYAVGWAVGAVATVVLICLPMPLESRVVVAFSFGPILGSVIHLIALKRHEVRHTKVTFPG